MTLLNIARAETVLDEQGLDGLLATSLENVYYLSNHWCDNFFVLPRQTQCYSLVARQRLGEPATVCSLSEVANVLANGPDTTTIIPFGVFYRFVENQTGLSELELRLKERVVDGLHDSKASPAEALLEAFRVLGLNRGRVAYDECGLFPPDVPALLERQLPEVQLVAGSAIFRSIRSVKTEVEVKRLVRVLRLTERAIQAAMNIAASGVTEHEMVIEFEKTVVDGGGRPLLTQIYFGPNGSSGYVWGRNAVLSPGEVIRFDVGCVLDGYTSDIARNFSLGPPSDSDRVQKYYEAILAGETAAIDMLRPGVTASRIFETALQVTRESGIPHYNRSHVGHGIGLEMYDPPNLRLDDQTPLEAGMVLDVETPYYELGFPGLQVEDTVLVGEKGATILTELNRSLQIVEV
jgi:Xaa-Pro dipeptidase